MVRRRDRALARTGPQRFPELRSGLPFRLGRQSDAARLLAIVAGDGNAPAVARASALSELGTRATPANLNLARTAIIDPDPMVRIGALDLLGNAPLEQRWSIA